MRNWFNRLRDTMDEAIHDSTDVFLRCTSTNSSGHRCIHDKGHSSPHEDAEGSTW